MRVKKWKTGRLEEGGGRGGGRGGGGKGGEGGEDEEK